MYKMATGDGKTKEYEIEHISTTEIVEKLEEYKHDNTEFFYLYVSTAGEEDDEEEPMHTDSNPPSSPPSLTGATSSETPLAGATCLDTCTPSLAGATPSETPSDVRKKTREKMMKKVHKEILPKVLAPLGWKKVYDKDMTLTYRALYFNIIQKHPAESENDDAYIQRVSKVRSTLLEEVNKVKEESKVNFKINSLLSKPFRYY